MRILAECKSCHAQYDVSNMAPGESVRCRCGASVLVAAPRVQDARVIRCASCGASRDSAGENCAFCGSRFSAVDKGWGSMCPVCYCRLPNDASFCVECGVKIAPITLHSAPSKLLCPRCTCALSARTFDTITLHECPSCAGTWLGVDTFEAVCKAQENQAIATRGLAGKRTRVKFELTENEKVKYVPCPVCKNFMNRRNFAGISGVVIDTCKTDGVWLDNQELSQIVKFIQSGGLEKSRARDAENAAHEERMRRIRVPAATGGGFFAPAMSSTARPPTGWGAADGILNVASVVADLFLRSH